ncbi:MAG: DUF5103 domain-containing protein, partial [Bacteroidota bacterium]|nr:DUF5103 domain-containing protein [Bacteroidota bacterium]
MQKILCSLLILVACQQVNAQRLPDHIYMQDIKTPLLFQQGNQSSLPLISLNSDEKLELHFDDFTGYPRNFYYTLVLCNADWTPADVNPFDYIRGFLQNRLSQYRVSSITSSKYVHYQALLPENGCVPVKSGNYLLKVFLDADTAKLAFTKRMMVVDKQTIIQAQVQQTFDNALFRTHQKLQLSVNTQNLNLLSPQQTQVMILQNNRWDDAVKNIQPTFIRGKVLEYNSEQDCVFP